MRVTKAIREYVEEQIRAKYDIKRNEMGAEYSAERDQVVKEVENLLDDANKKALEYLHSVGYEVVSYRNTCPLFSMYGRVAKQDVEERLQSERAVWNKKCEAKIKQVLFDLEMGETAKAELKDVLDRIVVD